MKILVLSDLHLDHYNWQIPELPEHDAVVLAGDIMAPPLKGLEWAEKTFQKPVIYVSGNHEYYGYNIQKCNDDVLDFYSDHVFYLNRYSSWVVIDGVRFVGSTLWTDFNLYNCQEACMDYAYNNMNDFHYIEYEKKVFTPKDSLIEHTFDKSAIFNEVDMFAKTEEQKDAFKTVIVTHHIPHPKFIAPQYSGDLLNPAFCSDLTKEINILQPDLWIFGHTHVSMDSYIGNTRFVCNPKGYGSENPYFNPALVIEV